MVNDRQLIQEIIRCCERILRECDEKTDLSYSLQNNLLLQESVLFNLIQIGENVNHLSEEFKEKQSQIPWYQIVGMRNIITHGYGSIDILSVAETVKEDIPVLRAQCEFFLENN